MGCLLTPEHRQHGNNLLFSGKYVREEAGIAFHLNIKRLMDGIGVSKKQQLRSLAKYVREHKQHHVVVTLFDGIAHHG